MFKIRRANEVAAAALLIAGMAGASFAQDAAGAIASRQAFMKGVTPMVTAITTAASKGDMAGARAAAKTMDDGWKVFAASFPAGSDSAAGKTRAKPEIWSDAAGFKAELDKAQASSAAILAATNGTDADAVLQQAGYLNCTSCHSTYRGPAIR